MTKIGTLVTTGKSQPLESWWDRYRDTLQESGMSVESIDAISEDVSEIVQNGVHGAGPLQEESWPVGRVRTAAVVGAVQSGKTASMLGVIAQAVDSGVDAVVLLGGTRTALWNQTIDRFNRQLTYGPVNDPQRIQVPKGNGSESRFDLNSSYRLVSQRVKRAVTSGFPIFAVVMKQVAHLERVAKELHKSLYPLATEDKPIHILVIDDEADDSSIEVGGSTNPLEYRQVPRRIVDLWSKRSKESETVNKNVFATYIGYTATPQANFLQDEDNILAPRDYVKVLRNPGPASDGARDRLTYSTSAGTKGWYTGGEVFYNLLEDVGVCRELPQLDSTNESALDEVINCARGFLVGAAIRFWRERNRAEDNQTSILGPTSGAQVTYPTAQAVRDNTSSPTSMLVHPSSGTETHFLFRDELMRWGGKDQSSVDNASLDSAKIADDIRVNHTEWRSWLHDYQNSAQLFAGVSNEEERFVPTDRSWDELVRLIVHEIVPSTRIQVINSDPRADERPNFDPVQTPNGWEIPTNQSTIFVSGNVMSRGITLEGLISAVFTREAHQPAADTQMQMQRWFGYRGSYIDLCRVNLSSRQLDLFKSFHETEVATRLAILDRVSFGRSGHESVPILQGVDFQATGKFGNLGSERLAPHPVIYYPRINEPQDDLLNQEFLIETLNVDYSNLIVVGGGRSGSRARGVVLCETLSAIEVADLLDGLQYPVSLGTLENSLWEGWNSTQRSLGITDQTFYSGPQSVAEVLPISHPSNLAAYLRFWHYLVETRPDSPGLSSTHEKPRWWSLIPDNVTKNEIPEFAVGFRFGSGSRVHSGPFASFPVAVHGMDRPVTNGVLHHLWGARGVDSSGHQSSDDRFDSLAWGDEIRPDTGGPRAPGERGLVLFQLIEREPGTVSIATSLSVPLGGPDRYLAKGV